MNQNDRHLPGDSWPTLAHFPLPGRLLVTMVIMTLSLAMAGALAQVIVHDVIPTYEQLRSGGRSDMQGSEPAVSAAQPAADRGDLFSGETAPAGGKNTPAFYESEQFVWTLKWTHIHLFGINMIFVFVGGIALFLDLSQRRRAWLIGLPFLGVVLDIAAMWLKAFVSPVFFWMHLPGGGLFGVIFAYVCARALWEMWGRRPQYN